MDHYTKDKDVVISVLYASIEVILFVIALLVFRIPVDHAILAIALGSLAGWILSSWVLHEILADDEKSDNTEDKGSADEKPEEYSEDETDLYDTIVNKPAETTDEKPVDTDAATETTDGTAGTGAEDETDDKA